MTFTTWLQSRLTAHQFHCGPADGIVGDLITAALRAPPRGVAAERI
ncbi:hypothetical protein [Puniceibacterium confluentis]|nr:hypothetical protein [Puniceibacterium confluentis]